MANLLYQPEIQFFDNNNLPLALGKVTTSLTGTATPATTYSDSTEDTANANPIILDASGRAPIWLPIGIDYRFTVTDADDNAIDTFDNVSTNAATFTSLITQSADYDLNGFSIITNNNQDIPIQPNGTGVTEVHSPKIMSDIDMNGNDLLLDSGNSIKDGSGTKKVLDLGITSSAVNNLKVTNSATGNPVIIEAEGTDTNIDILLTPKGSGAITVPNNYEDAVTSDDDLASKKYADTTLLVADQAVTLEGTSLISKVGPKHIRHSRNFVSLAFRVDSCVGLAPTPLALGEGFSITNTATGKFYMLFSELASQDSTITAGKIDGSIVASAEDNNYSVVITSFEDSMDRLYFEAFDTDTGNYVSPSRINIIMSLVENF